MCLVSEITQQHALSPRVELSGRDRGRLWMQNKNSNFKAMNYQKTAFNLIESNFISILPALMWWGWVGLVSSPRAAAVAGKGTKRSFICDADGFWAAGHKKFCYRLFFVNTFSCKFLSLSQESLHYCENDQNKLAMQITDMHRSRSAHAQVLCMSNYLNNWIID